MLNLGHRGFSGAYPENTMLAFEKACQVEGCDGIETDVHLTADGELVLIHDEEIDRTCTDGKGWIRDLTFNELRKLDFSYTYAGQCERQPIPTLSEFLDLVKQYDRIANIELKTGVLEYPGIEEKTYALIKDFGLEERVIISSFNHYSVLRFQKIAPMIKCGLLVDSWLIDAGAYVQKNGVQCYHPRFNNMTDEYVKDLRTHGIEINVWTVNEEEDVREMLRVGVDAIIGNYPDRAAKVIRACGRNENA